MGGVIMIFGIVAMVMIHEAGHFFAAKAAGMKVTEFFFGFGPRLWSVRRGETEYGLKALPLGGYVRIVGMNPYEDVSPADEGRTYREKSFPAKAIVVLAGIASHFVVAFLIFWVVFAFVGVHDPDRPLPVIFEVVAELEDGTPTPAAQAGLASGDRFLEVAGRPVSTWREVAETIHEHPDETVELVLERDGEVIRTQVTLATLPDDQGRPAGFLGFRPDLAVTRVGPIAAAGQAGGSVGEVAVQSVVGLGRLVAPDTLSQYVSALFSGTEVEPELRPISPVGLVRLGAQAQQFGLENTLGLLAVFNVFVGLLNVLPVYPFDGGHFAVALYERVSGRRADVRKLVPVAAVVIAVLGFLFVTALYMDIVNPLPGLG